jgi:hypothetical protein
MEKFKYLKLSGRKLSPESMEGREPRLNEVYVMLADGRLQVEEKEMVPVTFYDGVSWLSSSTYERAKRILGTCSYEAHEGVTLTSAGGAWIVINGPEPVEPPVGTPKGRRYVRVETKLGRELNLGPFIVEEDFIFKGFKGEDVEVGKVANYRYFVIAYKRDGSPLPEGELRSTLLWRNYLEKILGRLKGFSKHMKKSLWHSERMAPRALMKIKVVWRDVASHFIPAVEDTGAIPDNTVHYIEVESLEEAYYILAVLLAPQINAVVEELVSWIGHVQPRFVNYFRIPKYNPQNEVHKELAKIGKRIHNDGKSTANELRKKIEELVEILDKSS